MIEELKKRWKGYKEKRFLETHGCKTWREYERRYDKDIGSMARWAHTFYHGYPYIYPLDPQGLRDYGMLGVLPYHDLADQMTEWCEQNCQGRWRNDWHRGFWDQQGNFELNGIGGGDIMFFAFKEESDYVWFTLVWS
jgi:hypothetical protein